METKEHKLEEISKKRSELSDLYLNGFIDDDIYLEKLTELNNESFQIINKDKEDELD